MTSVPTPLARIGLALLALVAMPVATLEAQPLSTAPTAIVSVRPSEDVVRNVVVRAGPSSSTRAVAALQQGETATVVSLGPRWVQVRLPDGRTGWVSRRWVVDAGAEARAASAHTFGVEAIDVGTGLAILVTGPDFTLLYDGGSNDDVATGEGNRLLSYLRAAHPTLRRLDVLVLSHPHRDHVELLADVVDRYEVVGVWDSGRTNPICGYRAFITAIAVRPAITYHNAVEDDGPHLASFPSQTCQGRALPAATIAVANATRMKLGEPVPLGAAGTATMTILSANGSPLPDFNANSVVVRLDLGGRSVLLMGDAEAGGRQDPDRTPEARSIEGRLLSCCLAKLRADVLVVGHHGSKTSSRTAFLDAVGARDFIVSAGPTRYASVTLPDAVVIAELMKRGRVWRTDRDDAACMVAPAKVGTDADGEAGGCDNALLTLDQSGVRGSYARLVD